VSIRARFRLPYPAFTLDVDVDLPGGGITAVFGRSGSGKTTLLRCIAGLEPTADGLLTVNGETWQDGARRLPVHRRSLGYVFQEARLFPHLSVAANLDFGRRRIAERERRVSLTQAVELLGIAHLLERRPERLSGGERQRVAIARALATSPRLLLMDEPLAALDHARKQEILPYLERLHDELEIPVLYVSHSPDEVARLADQIVVMDDGPRRRAGPADRNPGACRPAAAPRRGRRRRLLRHGARTRCRMASRPHRLRRRRSLGARRWRRRRPQRFACASWLAT
jgi:molybdate transport system ATP-binding protein